MASGPQLPPAAGDQRRENDSAAGEDLRDCATTANATASFVTIPAEVKTTTPAPAWVAAPAGPIGSAAAAAPAER